MSKKNSKLLTAKQLGITVPERKALIAFTRNKVVDDDVILMNGVCHFYDQSYVSNRSVARNHHCGTAGCVAGFVWHHVAHVQEEKLSTQNTWSWKTRSLRNALDYFNDRAQINHPLYLLYIHSTSPSIEHTRKVVGRFLETGGVNWYVGL